MSKLASVSIGVNLDTELRPYEATIISINDQRYVEAPLLKKLLKKNDDHDSLYTQNEIHPHKKKAKGVYSGELKTNADEQINKNMMSHTDIYSNNNTVVSIDSTAIQLTLINDLHNILIKALKPMESVISRYTRVNTRSLINLKKELAYYLGVVNFIRNIKSSGLPLCRPKIIKHGQKKEVMESIYNVKFALRKMKVTLNTKQFQACSGKQKHISPMPQSCRTIHSRG